MAKGIAKEVLESILASKRLPFWAVGGAWAVILGTPGSTLGTLGRRRGHFGTRGVVKMRPINDSQTLGHHFGAPGVDLGSHFGPVSVIFCNFS